LPLLLLGVGAACSKGPAFGSDNAIVAVIDPGVRETLEPLVREALEREVFTTRSERVFEVTVTTPAEIGDFRKWARLLVIEPVEGARLVPDLVGDLEGPVFTRVEDEWARDQTVWVIAAATPQATVELARTRLDSVYGAFHDAWVAHQVDRMWASEPDSAGARRMTEELGFSIVIPRVYRPASSSAPPDTRTWYNEDPRRVLSLHWEPAPSELRAEHVLAARRTWGADLFPGDEVAASLPGDTTAGAGEARSAGDRTAPGDTTPGDTTPGDTAPAAEEVEPPTLLASRTTLDARPAVRLQGVWANRSDLTSGLFLTYGVLCGDRLVLIDGNLYAPDRDKYAYLLQFERISETFRCGAG
jgi:hypothetical protein